jgi:hypothetical protein
MLLISSGKAERKCRARDAAMPGVTQALRDARDLLLVTNRDNPKALGDFGYEVERLAPVQSQTRALTPRAFSRSHAHPKSFTVGAVA